MIYILVFGSIALGTVFYLVSRKRKKNGKTHKRGGKK